MPDLTVVQPDDRRCASVPHVGPTRRCDRIAGHEGNHIAWTLVQSRPAKYQVWFRS